MQYYLVAFTLNQNYFQAVPQNRNDLTQREVAYGVDLFKAGIWQHAYTTPGDIKTQSWAIYKTEDRATLDRYLAGYPMDQAGMYTKEISEVTIVDPPWIVRIF